MKKYLTVILLLLSIQTGWASQNFPIIPGTQNFDNNTWLSEIMTDCGSTTTWETTGCYSGGCLKTIAPTSACAGAGTNGGAGGFGWTYHPSLNNLHYRFLIKFKPQYIANIANGGGSTMTKFVNVQDDTNGSPRSGILGLHCSDSPRYCHFGVAGDSGVYWHHTSQVYEELVFGNEDPAFRIYASGQNTDVWLSVEYWIKLTSPQQTGVTVTKQDGTSETVYTTTLLLPSATQQTGAEISYFNCYVIPNSNAYFMIDNLVISNDYIGPPAGFVGGGGDTTAPVVTITSPTSSATYSTSSSTVTLAGTATDAVGVTGITWSNDRGGSGDATCTGCTGTSVTWNRNSIALQTGVNVITISGTDGTNTGTDILTVTYTPTDTEPPVLSALLPTGAQTCTGAGVANIALSLTTNEAATCRMATTDIAYASMTDTFTTTGGTSHSETKSLACGQTIYTYYVRCSDASANANTSSEAISFWITKPGAAGGVTFGEGVAFQ